MHSRAELVVFLSPSSSGGASLKESQSSTSTISESKEFVLSASNNVAQFERRNETKTVQK
jgi:hypothetical protein